MGAAYFCTCLVRLSACRSMHARPPMHNPNRCTSTYVLERLYIPSVHGRGTGPATCTSAVVPRSCLVPFCNWRGGWDARAPMISLPFLATIPGAHQASQWAQLAGWLAGSTPDPRPAKSHRAAARTIVCEGQRAGTDLSSRPNSGCARRWMLPRQTSTSDRIRGCGHCRSIVPTRDGVDEAASGRPRLPSPARWPA